MNNPSHWAYPRSHGATTDQRQDLPNAAGLSPLARGNRCARVAARAEAGPIPARTGQPHRRPGRAGKPWPIPARTGQPQQFCTQGSRTWAYPRSHGATWKCAACWRRARGLSPLARGNRGHRLGPPAWRGPIPARTGQPNLQSISASSNTAYPRSHGATAPLLPLSFPSPGLSPLARGNRALLFAWGSLPGPIPARTGQPRADRGMARPSKAYPRSHGATDAQRVDLSVLEGLSPLARGNQAKALAARRV